MPLRRKPRHCGITRRSEQPQFSRQQKLMMTTYNVYYHKTCVLLAKVVENIHDRCPCGVSF